MEKIEKIALVKKQTLLPNMMIQLRCHAGKNIGGKALPCEAIITVN